jgi:hypothetical protein
MHQLAYVLHSLSIAHRFMRITACKEGSALRLHFLDGRQMTELQVTSTADYLPSGLEVTPVECERLADWIPSFRETSQHASFQGGAPNFARLALVLKCANAFDSERGLNFMKGKNVEKTTFAVLKMGLASAPVMTVEPRVSQS